MHHPTPVENSRQTTIHTEEFQIPLQIPTTITSKVVLVLVIPMHKTSHTCFMTFACDFAKYKDTPNTYDIKSMSVHPTLDFSK